MTKQVKENSIVKKKCQKYQKKLYESVTIERNWIFCGYIQNKFKVGQFSEETLSLKLQKKKTKFFKKFIRGSQRRKRINLMEYS